jgi:hypothetical protein
LLSYSSSDYITEYLGYKAGGASAARWPAAESSGIGGINVPGRLLRGLPGQIASWGILTGRVALHGALSFVDQPSENAPSHVTEYRAEGSIGSWIFLPSASTNPCLKVRPDHDMVGGTERSHQSMTRCSSSAPSNRSQLTEEIWPPHLPSTSTVLPIHSARVISESIASVSHSAYSAWRLLQSGCLRHPRLTPRVGEQEQQHPAGDEVGN